MTYSWLFLHECNGFPLQPDAVAFFAAQPLGIGTIDSRRFGCVM